MNNKTIEILNVMFLRGPNIWTYRSVLEAWVDIGDLEDCPSNTIPGFTDRLMALLPGLIEHRCSVGERGGFLQRLRDGTWPAHILEHAMVELQTLAGMDSGFGRARETVVRGIYKVAVRVRHEEVGRAALVDARDLVMAAIEERPFDVEASVARLRTILEHVALGPSTACIVEAAAGRGIPSIRLTDGNLVQLGYGSRQRRIWTAETDCTGAVAESISRDKDLTKGLLQSCGVPVPKGRIAGNAEDAWEAAGELGLPVVVKPSDGNHGRGVTVNLRERAEIEAAWTLADSEGSDVIVERYIEGDEHRLLVVGSRVVAAARGETAAVVGDGRSTIAELIDIQINSDPRRGDAEEFPLNLLLPDSDPAVKLELTRQKLTPASVPAAGQTVVVARHGNVAIDVTDRVHPEFAAAASLAARVVGLDIAGVDLVAKDISQPMAEQGAAIVEVNAGPGLLMHLKPAEGTPRAVGADIARHLFADDEDGRIPIVGITGSNAGGGSGAPGSTAAVARLVAHLLHLHGARVGLACADGLTLRGRRIDAADCAHREAGERLLVNRAVDAAVIENGFRSILTEGLAYDRCKVGIVTAIDVARGLPDLHAEGIEQLHKVARTQVDVVLPHGAAVLNADDAHVAALAPLCDGDVIFYSAMPDSARVAAHRSDSGRAVLVRDGCILLATGTRERLLACPEAIALAREHCAVGDLLAAVGAGWALGIPEDLIRAGIKNYGLQRRDVAEAA